MLQAMLNKQNGNAILVVLIFTALLGGVGYYAFTKGRINTNIVTPPTTFDSNSETGENAYGSTYSSGDMNLEITSPIHGELLTSNKIKVTGKTTAFAEVFINDQSTTADADGNFSLDIEIEEGENILYVSANDSEGNISEQNISVNVQTF